MNKLEIAAKYFSAKGNEKIKELFVCSDGEAYQLESRALDHARDADCKMLGGVKKEETLHATSVQDSEKEAQEAAEKAEKEAQEAAEKTEKEAQEAAEKTEKEAQEVAEKEAAEKAAQEAAEKEVQEVAEKATKGKK